LAAGKPDGGIEKLDGRVGTPPANDKMENSFGWQRNFL
jgi:hypothetical protein